MSRKNIFLIAFVLLIITSFFIWKSCSNRRLEDKGFPINNSPTTENSEEEKVEGIKKDSLKFETRPSNVLLTGISNVRLTSIYKVNLNKRDGTTFIGSNNYLYNDTELGKGNNWNGNLVPGLEGISGTTW